MINDYVRRDLLVQWCKGSQESSTGTKYMYCVCHQCPDPVFECTYEHAGFRHLPEKGGRV